MTSQEEIKDFVTKFYHVHSHSFEQGWIVVGDPQPELLEEGDGRTRGGLAIGRPQVDDADQGGLNVLLRHPLEDLRHPNQTPCQLK